MRDLRSLAAPHPFRLGCRNLLVKELGWDAPLQRWWFECKKKKRGEESTHAISVPLPRLCVFQFHICQRAPSTLITATASCPCSPSNVWITHHGSTNLIPNFLPYSIHLAVCLSATSTSKRRVSPSTSVLDDASCVQASSKHATSVRRPRVLM